MDISISRLRKVLPVFAESFDRTLILTFLMTIQCTIGCSRCLEKLFHRISLISRIFPPLYLRLSEYFLNIYDMYPPGTQSKLWHFYPRANSNPLQNNEKLFGKDTNLRSDGGRWKSIASQFFKYFFQFYFFLEIFELESRWWWKSYCLSALIYVNLNISREGGHQRPNIYVAGCPATFNCKEVI